MLSLNELIYREIIYRLYKYKGSKKEAAKSLKITTKTIRNRLRLRSPFLIAPTEGRWIKDKWYDGREIIYPYVVDEYKKYFKLS